MTLRGRPPSSMRRIALAELAARPLTMRQLSASLQMTIPQANWLLLELRQRGEVQVIGGAVSPPARRPVALYAASAAPMGAAAELQQLICRGLGRG